MRAGEVHVWRSELRDRDSAEDRALLSNAELERANRLRDRRLSHRYVARHALMRRLLSAYVGVAAAEIAYSQSALGKPCLAGEAWTAGWRFNVSESEGRCLIAISRDIEVGVDIQAMRPIDDLPALAREVLTDDELDGLLALDDDARVAAFYEIWARKEAVVKATGEGLARALNTVRLDGGGGKWIVAWSEIGDRYASALATDKLPTKLRFLHAG